MPDTDLDPMVYLDIRMSCVKMQSLTSQFVLHLVAARELYIEFHFCGPNASSIIVEVAE